MSTLSLALSAGLWPLSILAIAVVIVATIALARADKRDIPAIFESFAQAFGLHTSSGQRDTEQIAAPAEIEQPGQEM
ncbi:hypothetical protein [Nocardia otitidiscaviarum]|uniref:hypothetical protein n=1 Tax=Nocardia otitidiscaviarum TaxID=1823 RepID=UPI002458AD27|nr:hypothetical protein [Nocardia otitidiscaviarum]